MRKLKMIFVMLCVAITLMFVGCGAPANVEEVSVKLTNEAMTVEVGEKFIPTIIVTPLSAKKSMEVLAPKGVATPVLGEDLSFTPVAIGVYTLKCTAQEGDILMTASYELNVVDGTAPTLKKELSNEKVEKGSVYSFTALLSGLEVTDNCDAESKIDKKIISLSKGLETLTEENIAEYTFNDSGIYTAVIQLSDLSGNKKTINHILTVEGLVVSSENTATVVETEKFTIPAYQIVGEFENMSVKKTITNSLSEKVDASALTEYIFSAAGTYTLKYELLSGTDVKDSYEIVVTATEITATIKFVYPTLEVGSKIVVPNITANVVFDSVAITLDGASFAIADEYTFTKSGYYKLVYICKKASKEITKTIDFYVSEKDVAISFENADYTWMYGGHLSDEMPKFGKDSMKCNFNESFRAQAIFKTNVETPINKEFITFWAYSSVVADYKIAIQDSLAVWMVKDVLFTTSGTGWEKIIIDLPKGYKPELLSLYIDTADNQVKNEIIYVDDISFTNEFFVKLKDNNDDWAIINTVVNFVDYYTVRGAAITEATAYVDDTRVDSLTHTFTEKKLHNIKITFTDGTITKNINFTINVIDMQIKVINDSVFENVIENSKIKIPDFMLYGGDRSTVTITVNGTPVAVGDEYTFVGGLFTVIYSSSLSAAITKTYNIDVKPIGYLINFENCDGFTWTYGGSKSLDNVKYGTSSMHSNFNVSFRAQVDFGAGFDVPIKMNAIKLVVYSTVAKEFKLMLQQNGESWLINGAKFTTIIGWNEIIIDIPSAYAGKATGIIIDTADEKTIDAHLYLNYVSFIAEPYISQEGEGISFENDANQYTFAAGTSLTNEQTKFGKLAYKGDFTSSGRTQISFGADQSIPSGKKNMKFWVYSSAVGDYKIGLNDNTTGWFVNFEKFTTAGTGWEEITIALPDSYLPKVGSIIIDRFDEKPSAGTIIFVDCIRFVA